MHEPVTSRVRWTLQHGSQVWPFSVLDSCALKPRREGLDDAGKKIASETCKNPALWVNSSKTMITSRRKAPTLKTTIDNDEREALTPHWTFRDKFSFKNSRLRIFLLKKKLRFFLQTSFNGCFVFIEAPPLPPLHPCKYLLVWVHKLLIKNVFCDFVFGWVWVDADWRR